MPDWSASDARQAASERHQRELRRHTGYPRSNGSTLGLLCSCGQDFTATEELGAIAHWELHLTVVVEALEQ